MTTRARSAQRIRVGDVRHDPRNNACPSWCDLWPACRVTRARTPSSRRPSTQRPRVRLGRSRNGEDEGARRALRRAPSARTVSTSARSSSSRTRSARPASCARGFARGLLERRPPRPGPRARRCVDLDYPRLLQPAAEDVSARSGTGPALPRARRRAGRGAARRGVRGCARGVLRGREPERLRLLATYGASGLRRMLTGVFETLRSAGRELVLELGAGPSLPDAVERLAEAARCLVDDAGATDTSAPSPPARSKSSKTSRARTTASTWTVEGARRARRVVRRGPPGGRAGRRSTRPRRTTARCSRSADGFAANDQGARTASRCSTSRSFSCAHATCCAQRGHRTRRAAPVPLDHGGRVPGHEPAAARAPSTSSASTPTCSSSGTSSSRSTASGTQTLASSASTPAA